MKLAEGKYNNELIKSSDSRDAEVLKLGDEGFQEQLLEEGHHLT